jgi:acetyl-CoA C-acetyltransferase
MQMAWISGVGLTPFGRLPGRSAIDWQAAAAEEALADAALDRRDVDGVIAGYATTLRHLMPADVLAERLAIRPATAFGTSAGGATGLIMLAQAVSLVMAGMAKRILVVAGEDRASGQSTGTSMDALAQVGHPGYEVPLGATVPAYYALLASRYLSRHGLRMTDLAPLAVLMRSNAVRHPGAQFRSPITVADVEASRPVADPLRLLDCCPVSDGGAAFLVTAQPAGPRAVRVAGVGQAHHHQHVSEADLDDLGARRSAQQALSNADADVRGLDLVGIYDSFTITLALLLEEIGLCRPGTAGAEVAAGHFASTGRLPLNTHGGLLSYGHSGVAGGMAHVVEVITQLRGEAGDRQISRPLRRALVHADGGVLSAHVTVVLEAGQ